MTSATPLVGIARLASQGRILKQKNRVEYKSLPSRQLLNACHSGRVPFTWTINPYRGCEYGCKYCYARYTHDFLELHKPEEFETKIYAKTWDRQAFRAELRSVKPGQAIGIGTATDPYQPAERQFGLTGQVLDAMLMLRGCRIFITTKSDLVVRDAVTLRNLSLHNDVSVTLTVTTLDRKLARSLEPQAPRPDLRLKAVRKLAEMEINVGVIASPVLPLLTDTEENLQAVAEAAREAGAKRFGAGVLFLKPSAQRVFYPFLAEKYPEYLGRYRVSYEDNAYLRGKYPERIGKMVEAIRERLGLSQRDTWFSAPAQTADPQFSLF